MKRVPKPVDPLEQHLARPVPRRGRRAAPKAVARPAVMVDAAPTPNFATFGLPRPAPKRAKGADVIGSDTDVTLELVEAMMDEGIDVVAANSMVQLSALWANRPALGRPSEAPRLDHRTPRPLTNGEPGRRMAVIVFVKRLELRIQLEIRY